MSDGYVKIEVIEIYPEYKKTSLPELSCYEELEDYGDAIGHFIQWPLSSIKLSNIEATHHLPTMIQPAHENTCYSPEVRSLVWVSGRVTRVRVVYYVGYFCFI
ncbi:hypothetical protein Hanom_Chr06g00517561 [Helianthus anomalus]